MIYDIITYNGEKELLDLRLHCLDPYVDKFVVIEFDKTFSGKEKYSKFDIKDYPGFEDKIAYFYSRDYDKYRELAYKSPNTIGAQHWKTEFMMKESIKDALESLKLKDDDICFIGDVDEIWSPEALTLDGVNKLKLRVYAYYLNNRSTEQFWGTIKAPYEVIKSSVLNHLRTTAPKTSEYYGWHFTSMAYQLEQKLNDSYTRESYLTPWVESNLTKNIAENKDFLGRGFKYCKDESAWPQYLKDNKLNYQQLCK